MEKDQLALPETGLMQFYWFMYFLKNICYPEYVCLYSCYLEPRKTMKWAWHCENVKQWFPTQDSSLCWVGTLWESTVEGKVSYIHGLSGHVTEWDLSGNLWSQAWDHLLSS